MRYDDTQTGKIRLGFEKEKRVEGENESFPIPKVSGYSYGFFASGVGI